MPYSITKTPKASEKQNGATYPPYLGMIKKPIKPYFCKKKLTLRELKARHLQMFYSEMLKRVKPNTVIHYHAFIQR